MDSLHHSLNTILVERLGWPSEAAAEIAECAHIVGYEKDAAVFHAGEPTDLLYVLLSGEVKLYYGTAEGERLLVAIARSGQILGFTDLDAGDTRDAEQKQLFTGQALSRCKVAIIAWARVARALRDLPGQQLVQIVRRINDEWVALCCRFLTFLTMDVRGRLAYTIADIAERFGIPDARGKLITLKLSHEDFAELVGASRPMVSKHLKELAKAGIFAKENARYILAHGEGLMRVAASRPVADRSANLPAPGPRVLNLRAAPRRVGFRGATAIASRRAAE
jgi:CRP/FNR family cyclic AMP-dependent transcriptional regulator